MLHTPRSLLLQYFLGCPFLSFAEMSFPEFLSCPFVMSCYVVLCPLACHYFLACSWSFCNNTASFGWTCPSDVNPADFLMDSLSRIDSMRGHGVELDDRRLTFKPVRHVVFVVVVIVVVVVFLLASDVVVPGCAATLPAACCRCLHARVYY
jgi:hypothetical protein